MKLRNILLLSLATTTLLVTLPTLYTYTAPAVAQNRPSRTGLSYKTYIEPKFYSLDYPSGWFVDRSSEKLVIFTSLKPKLGGGQFPPQLVKTDVQLEDISFEEKIKQTQTPSQYSPEERLNKVEKLKIDNREASRFWFTGGDTHTLVTVIRYAPNKIAYMASFYVPSNSRGRLIAEKMHNSFKILNQRTRKR